MEGTFKVMAMRGENHFLIFFQLEDLTHALIAVLFMFTVGEQRQD